MQDAAMRSDGKRTSSMRAAEELISRLSSSEGRRDERPNRALAAEIASAGDAHAAAALAGLLMHKKKAVRHDAAKVLAALAAVLPELVLPHRLRIADLLESGRGPLVWSATEALERTAHLQPADAFRLMPRILAGVESAGSVIARDHAAKMLARFAAFPAFAVRATKQLLRLVETCPPFQLPSYFELALGAVPPSKRAAFVAAVGERIGELSRPSQWKRIDRAMKRAARSSA